MANQFDAPLTAVKIGSDFVQQYYHVFQQRRDHVDQFYTDESCMIRVDGETSHSASNAAQIHQLIMSLNITGIEIKTVNSLESLNGGVLVVSGSVKSRDFSGQRKFLQTFFLAPQEGGFFVLNDMFHFAHDELVHQPSAPATQEQNVDHRPTISTHLPDPLESGYALEEEASGYVNSVYIEGEESAEEFSHQEQHQLEPKPEPEFSYQEQHQPEPEPEPEPVQEPELDKLEEETPSEFSTASHQNNVTSVLQPSAEEPVGQPVKQTYASILLAKGKSSPSFSSQPPLLQQSSPSLSNSGLDAVEEPLSSGEGESKSVFVKNLPSTVTSLDILYEFKIFGKIKPDGVFLRNRQDTGACYAFVEFEDAQSVRNAIEASPIQLAGRRVYVEERKPNIGSFRGGRGRGGRGRGGHGGKTSGRGTEQNGSDNRVRTNRFRS